MDYIHEQVESWIESFAPDKVTYHYLSDSEKLELYQPSQRGHYPYGVWLRYNNLHVSIQWHKYSYCDYYSGLRMYAEEVSYRYDFPFTLTAAVAIVSSDNRYVPLTEEEYAQQEWAYQSASQIEGIIRTVSEYAKV